MHTFGQHCNQSLPHQIRYGRQNRSCPLEVLSAVWSSFVVTAPAEAHLRAPPPAARGPLPLPPRHVAAEPLLLRMVLLGCHKQPPPLAEAGSLTDPQQLLRGWRLHLAACWLQSPQSWQGWGCRPGTAPPGGSSQPRHRCLARVLKCPEASRHWGPLQPPQQANTNCVMNLSYMVGISCGLLAGTYYVMEAAV